MPKKVLVIETSLRSRSNTDRLAEEFARGAKDAGNDVEVVSLKGKRIAFCTGCLACLEKGRCVIEDDSNDIAEKIAAADVVAWAAPVYYYCVPGQLKTLIDRVNCLYAREMGHKDVYLLSASQDDGEHAGDYALNAIQGWVDCFSCMDLAGGMNAGGVDERGDIEKHPEYLEKAYGMGREA